MRSAGGSVFSLQIFGVFLASVGCLFMSAQVLSKRRPDLAGGVFYGFLHEQFMGLYFGF